MNVSPLASIRHVTIINTDSHERPIVSHSLIVFHGKRLRSSTQRRCRQSWTRSWRALHSRMMIWSRRLIRSWGGRRVRA